MRIDVNTPRTLGELTSKRRAIIYRAAGLLALSARYGRDPRLTNLELTNVNLHQELFDLSEEAANIANGVVTQPEDNEAVIEIDTIFRSF